MHSVFSDSAYTGNLTCSRAFAAFYSILNLAFFFHFPSSECILCSQIVHTRGIQLVEELLLFASDTLHSQCRHLEHMHEDIGY